MGKLTTCCCDCCIEPAEMPYTTVTLKAPLGCLDPGGGIGAGEDPEYPVANFERQGCCYVADFDIGCQEWIYNCKLMAKQTISASYSRDEYQSKVPYVAYGVEPDCDCIKTQTIAGTVTETHRAFLAARHRLESLSVIVGKALVQCDGDESPSCKFFIAVNYRFEGDVTLLAQGNSLDAKINAQTDCTGHYRNGDCSITSSKSTSTGWDSDSCPPTETIASQFANPLLPGAMGRVFTRIKLYDTLPSGIDVSINDADFPPVNCCGSETGCELKSEPCFMSVEDNCVIVATGGNFAFFSFSVCSTLDENNDIILTCPTKIDRVGFSRRIKVYRVDSDCPYWCDNASQQYLDQYTKVCDFPGFEQLICGYDDNGDPIPAPGIGGPGCEEITGLCSYTSGCVATAGGCYLLTGPDCGTIGGVQTCPDLEVLCRVDYTTPTCTIGEVTTYGDFEVCFSIPTATITPA